MPAQAATGAQQQAMQPAQRALIRPPGLVMAGRDIGTVIVPDAPLKIWLNASAEEDLNAAFLKLAELQAGGLIIGHDVFFNAQTLQLAALAARHKIPAIYTLSEFTEAGGLLSYGVSVTDVYRQCAVYTAAILKGAKPADLPVVQPGKFELIINLKTARALGLKISDNVISLADEVIE